MAVLDRHRRHVAAQFEQIFSDKSETLAGGSASSGESSTQWDFPIPELLAQRLDGVRASGRYQNLPEGSRQRFDRLVHSAVCIAMGQAAHTSLHLNIGPQASQFRPEARGIAPPMTDETLLRFLDLLEAISRRSAYLALLCEYPVALERVLAVLGSSRWAARYLNAHPQLLDELLDDEALAAPLDISAFSQRLRQRLEQTDGVEQQMDSLRHAHQAEVFQIVLRDLAGQLTVEVVSDRLSELADVILDATLQAAWNALPAKLKCADITSGNLPKFAIIAYGKLGGKELGYISDLDLIFLYDDPDGNASERYAALTRRLIAWLTSATGAGVLFDIDLRLRPSGASGLLVTSLQAFREYQLHSGAADVAAANTAWVWEHQALTRARFSAGDRELGAAFEAIRAEVMRQRRDAAALAQEIVAMRARMAEGHINRSVLFDLKHDRGGMIDIEFIVQYLILLHAHAHPCLIGNTGNINLLRELAGLNLLSEQEAQQVGDAYRTYRALQHRFRLDGEELARVEPAQVAQERSAVLKLWERVLGNKMSSS
jgi:glutamate-ammonia-ligase adenylyltransferase